MFRKGPNQFLYRATPKSIFGLFSCTPQLLATAVLPCGPFLFPLCRPLAHPSVSRSAGALRHSERRARRRFRLGCSIHQGGLPGRREGEDVVPADVGHGEKPLFSCIEYATSCLPDDDDEGGRRKVYFARRSNLDIIFFSLEELGAAAGKDLRASMPRSCTFVTSRNHRAKTYVARCYDLTPTSTAKSLRYWAGSTLVIFVQRPDKVVALVHQSRRWRCHAHR